SIDIVAKTQVQSELRQRVPVILHVSRRLPAAPCGHLDRVPPGDGCRQAAQQDGKIVARARKSRISAANVRIPARMRALCLSAWAADDPCALLVFSPPL